MENDGRPCTPGENCTWGLHNDKLVCVHGSPPDCFNAQLLELEISSFHSESIANATREINRILSEIAKDADGRTLSFIQVKGEIMLALVKHDENAVVNAAKDDDAIAAVFKLKNNLPASSKNESSTE